MAQHAVGEFDLNIERVLEHWTVAYAIRELIANALDEHVLTATREPEISKDRGGSWHIRDFGRGLKYQHLTQKENKEKLRRSEDVIGKFGVGLKDALATLNRRRISVTIRSRHSDISIGMVQKHGFERIKTLHALIAEPSDPELDGTDIILAGVNDKDVETAKNFFLRYAGEEILDTTPHGSVLRRTSKKAHIYVTGLRVAEEENFLFSYNITKLTAPLRKALNRERTNVGRGAYSAQVKALLLSSSMTEVAESLATELSSLEHGTTHDEVQWLDVQVHACQLLNNSGEVVFVTAQDMFARSKLIDYARSEGRRIVVVPLALAAKLPKLTDTAGRPIRDLDVFHHEWASSFSFTFVDPSSLSTAEKAVFSQTNRIIALLGKKRGKVREILISETMRVDQSGSENVGLWQPGDRSVIIKRSQLCELSSYAGTLLHELTHAATGTDDRTLEFEGALSKALGVVAAAALAHQPEN